MDTLSQLAAGFAVALTPYNLLWCLVGTTLGTAIGGCRRVVVLICRRYAK